MSTATQPAGAWTESGIAGYSAVCLAATGVIFLAFQQLGLGQVALFPAAIGSIGIAARLAVHSMPAGGRGVMTQFVAGLLDSTPLFLVITVGMCLSLGSASFLLNVQGDGLRIVDLALSAALLAYVIAFYRLQSVWKQILPGKRNLLEPAAKVEPVKRPARLIDSQELGWLLLFLPVWAGLAQVMWWLLPKQSGIETLIVPAYQAMVFIWGLAMIGFSAAGILDYLRRAQMTRDEALLVLQDELWHETRREQRQFNRWLAWEHRGRPSYLLPTLAVIAVIIALILVIILLI